MGRRSNRLTSRHRLLRTECLEERRVLAAPVAVDDEYVMDEDQTLVAGETSPAGIAPVEWSENGHYYLLVNLPSTPSGAITAATNYVFRGAQGHLVTLTSANEHAFVREQVLASHPVRVFLGLTDLTTEGDWEWVTGEPFVYSNWESGEPNNAGDEDYVEMKLSGQWNDVPDQDLIDPFVVEFDGPFGDSVIDNDSDPDGDMLTALLVQDVQNGTLEFDDDGVFTYEPNDNFNGTDRFTYRATDGESFSDPTTVTLVVSEVNDAPQAAEDDYTGNEDAVLTVDIEQGVLTNDTDEELDALLAALVDDVTHGSLTLNSDGSFTYSPSPDFFGTDHFSYQAHDGEKQSAPASVTLTVLPIDDPPLAVDDHFTIAEDEILRTGNGQSLPDRVVFFTDFANGVPDEFTGASSIAQVEGFAGRGLSGNVFNIRRKLIALTNISL